MSIGLDLGSHGFRSVRREKGRLVARRCRAAYSVLPDNDTQRRVLERSGISYASCEGNLVLLGDAAAELSRLFQVPCIDLLPDGAVPQADPIPRQIIAVLVDALLPGPRPEQEICCFTQPGHVLRRHGEKTGQLAFFTQLIRLRGYAPQPLQAGMALIYAELRPEAFTGVGITLGASCCEISVAHHGQEIASCSIPRGGQWIDEQLARESGAYCWDPTGNQLLDVEQVSREKESVRRSILVPVTPQEKLLADLYMQLVTHILETAGRELASQPRLADLRHSVSIVCGGGAANIPGFCDLLHRQMERRKFPLGIRDVRLAANSPDTISRGCLINAELETKALRTQQRSA